MVSLFSTMSRTEEPRHWPRLRLLVVVMTGLYIAGLLGVLALIYGPGERWWFTSLLLFSPKWGFAVPLGLLFVACLAFHRGLWLFTALVGAGLLLFGPVLGATVPLARLAPHSGNAPKVRVISWNVEGDSVTIAQLSKLLNEFRPDIVLLQECDARVLATVGVEWQTHESDKMCLLSRLPVRAIADRDRRDVWKKAGSGAIIRYTIEAPFGLFEVTNVHLETPRDGFEELLGGSLRSGIALLSNKNRQRYEEAALASTWANAGQNSARIVAGDFNTPPQSDILRNSWPGYTNCFDTAGFGFGHTKHTRKFGVRIDHVLASRDWRCASSTVVPNAGGSDHRPIVTELEWTGKTNH